MTPYDEPDAAAASLARGAGAPCERWVSDASVFSHGLAELQALRLREANQEVFDHISPHRERQTAVSLDRGAAFSTREAPRPLSKRLSMFPFPSPLDFLRAFTLAFLAGSAAGMGFVALTFALLLSFKRPSRLWGRA
jgi:hypothetical protein